LLSFIRAGEYAAAVVAGVLTIEGALQLVCARSRLVQEDRRCEGVMFAVRATADSILQALQTADPAVRAEAALAAANGKLSCVVSGSSRAVTRLLASMPTKPASVPLAVKHAFHSPLLGAIAAQYLEVIKTVSFSIPSTGPEPVLFLSTVRGRLVQASELCDPQYWLDHLLQPVQYQAAVECGWARGARTFIEMGPHDTLSKLTRRILADMPGRDKAAEFEVMASLV
jgi:acyl transferase domain-containing protein